MSDPTRGPRPVPDPRRSGDGATAEDRELLELIAALQAESAGPHPPPATLLAYRRDGLGETAAGQLQDHLVDCRACRNVLLDLDDLAGELEGVPGFEESGAEGVPAADPSREEEWRRLLARLPATPGEAAPGSGGSAPSPARALRRRGPDPRLGWLAAVALLLVSVGLAVQSARLSNVAGPQTNVPVVYLDAATRSASGEGDGEAVVVPATAGGSGVVVVMITPPDPAAFPAYRVEVEGGAGDWSLGGLRPAEPYGTLRLTLPAAALGEGPLHLRLLGVDEGGDDPAGEELAVYRLLPGGPAAGGSGARVP